MLMVFLSQEDGVTVVAGGATHADGRLYIKVNLAVLRLQIHRDRLRSKQLQERLELVCAKYGLGGQSVKRFERSNGLDTALYKKQTFTFTYQEAKTENNTHFS